MPASVVFNKPRQRVDLRDCYNWWIYVPGANWRHPEGPASSLKGKAKHPVVHVAYEDVEAYAKWIGKELPTEAEWEFAARGGLNGAEFVWAAPSRRTGNRWQIPGKVSFPGRISKKTDSKGQRRWEVFQPTAMGSTRWPATWEWTTDWYQEHKEIPQSAPTSIREVENETRATIPTCPTSKSRAK